MAQRVRQTRLFAAEDYMAVYDSYINANFKAFDFDTIRESMVEYIKTNYPESFNDWIESSEFVALLDVVAQFGHNLAFRLDLNARENFLSTAKRQDSVFKLSEFLGYHPRRNMPARGELKIVSVKTNEDVFGGNGTTLAGKEIRYENSKNNSIDDFVAVLNAALSEGNQFGNPRSQAVINGVATEIYSFNNKPNQIVFELSGAVSGSKKPFNAVGVDYNFLTRSLKESDPDPAKAFSIVFRNDGTGINSNSSGFFVNFKQGTLAFKDFVIESSIGSLSLDVDVNNINNEDVWVQSINDNGDVIKNWKKVDNVWGINEIYNINSKGDQDTASRDIFAVRTRENNQVSILFADEHFGNLPKNLIRVWYRVSENSTYVLRPDDIGSKKINLQYTGIDGNAYTLTLTVQLKKSVANASVSESLDDIRENAPKVYSAQDRMITADDYNNYISSLSTGIIKSKSINRTHSGHTRHLDLKDPTGEYSKVRLFATDGFLKKTDISKTDVANNLTSYSIFENYVKPLLTDHELLSLYYDKHKDYFVGTKESFSEVFYWNTYDGITGYMTDATSNVVGNNDENIYTYFLQPGAMVKFVNGPDVYWASVSKIFANGLGVDNNLGNPSGLTTSGLGAITLDASVPTGSTIEIIYMSFSRQFTVDEKTAILDAIENKATFAIGYKPYDSSWQIQTDPTISPAPEQFAFSSNNPDDWMMLFEYTGNIDSETSRFSYSITVRGIRYTLESSQIRFSNTSNEYRLDGYTKKKVRDSILFFRDGNEFEKFYVHGYNVDENGYYLTNSVNLSMIDDDENSRPDNPEVFTDIVGGVNTEISDQRFEWTHVPAVNELIDPSFSNIIDVFVLTDSYNTVYRNWLLNDSNFINEPLPPTIDELNQQFSDVSYKKSISDSVIYRPVKYKVLFGNKASYDLRAKFKVVKVAGTKYTNSDIKSMILNLIYEFFDTRNWDFGETFYFTELSSYIHKNMINIVSSFVIVPDDQDSVFGTLFQITPLSDELFIPDVSFNDIEIIDLITKENIKAIG
jgi:hypothetical protein